MPRRIGYARVSTQDQDCAIQRAALEAAGCQFVAEEKASGTTVAGRDQLTAALKLLDRGDVLTVTRIDRLARSIADLAKIVDDLQARGVALVATEQPVDTSTAAGRAFLQMLGVFAEFETAIRKERQLEGIAKAKSEGVYKGRPASIDVEAIREMHAAGVRPVEIARRLKVGRASVYRALGSAAA